MRSEAEADVKPEGRRPGRLVRSAPPRVRRPAGGGDNCRARHFADTHQNFEFFAGIFRVSFIGFWVGFIGFWMGFVWFYWVLFVLDGFW